MRPSPPFHRAFVAGLAGGLAWVASMMLLFGPAQAILANPDFQSRKFLAVMGQIEPLPRTASAVWILLAGVLLIAMLYGVVYRWIRTAFSGARWWSKGLRFGLIAWALMVPWFEFYLPWNVMHEPMMLVILEMVLWMGVMLAVGLAIAGVYERNLVSESADRHASGSSIRDAAVD